MREKYELQIYWDVGTSLVFVVPSWKQYGRDDFINEQILSLRMRPELIKENPIFIVMRDNTEKVRPA